MRVIGRRPFGAGLVGAVAGSSCRRPHDEAIVVFAAASLREVLGDALARFRAEAGVAARASFDASSRLARQIEAGAPADLFVSADAQWMDYLAARGRVLATSRADVASNRLVVVVPRGRGTSVRAAADLVGPGVRRLALAGEDVPAGRYAADALRSAGAWEAVSPKVVRGESVRVALEWVARGDADAGVVYVTDARVEPRVEAAFVFPEGSHPRVVYPAAVVAGAAHADAAGRLLAFLRGTEGRAAFQAHGFGAP